jgi:hypothetical protein
MRSKHVSFRLPWKLWDACKERCREEKYRNMGRYFTSIAIFDLLSRRPHKLTKDIANADPDEQDAIIDGLLSKVWKAEPGKMSWLDHRICEVVLMAQDVTDLNDLKAKLAELIAKELSQ